MTHLSIVTDREPRYIVLLETSFMRLAIYLLYLPTYKLQTYYYLPTYHPLADYPTRGRLEFGQLQDIPASLLPTLSRRGVNKREPI